MDEEADRLMPMLRRKRKINVATVHAKSLLCAEMSSALYL